MIKKVQGTPRSERDKPERRQNRKAERKDVPSFDQVLDKEAHKENNKAP